MLFRHRIIFVSLCVLLIAGNASAQSQPPAPSPATSNQQKQSKSTKTEPPPSNDLRGTYESPLVINVLPTPNADEIAKRKREQEEEKSTLDRWLTGATVALAVITFFLALYTARLWSATKESSQRQLRAYLSVVPQIDHVQFGQMPIARVLIENCGQTPAYQLTQVSGLAWGTTFDTLPPPVGPSGVSMAPLAPRGKNEIPIKSMKVLGASEVSQLYDGTLTLWVYGEIKYRDTFGENRFVKYRFMIGGTAGIMGNWMCICQEGNDQN